MRESIRNAGLQEDAEVLLVSRQPIYDREFGLFAYELLYGNETLENAPAARPGDPGTDVLLTALLDIGLETLTGDGLAFVNVSRESIVRGHCEALPAERVVLGISSDFELDESVLPVLRELKDSGYSLALDNFVYSEDKDPLLDLADYVIFRFDRFTRDEIVSQLPMLKKFRGKLLGRGLETHEEFGFARNAGFDYFRGSYFTQTKATKSTRVPLNRLATLQLVVRLMEPELSATALERAVSQDITISFKLLSYVNSAALALPRSVQSIRHAIQLVGTQRIRTWASLLLLTKLDDGPSELIVTALVRATMAERLATSQGAPNPESYFLAGLLSVIDALLNMSMAQAIELLPVAAAIGEALVRGTGPMGDTLRCVLAYERGQWSNVRCGQLSLTTIRQCYLDSLVAARATQSVSR